MKNTKYLIFFSILLFSFSKAFAQPEINIFGFFQSRLQQSNTNYSVDVDIPTPNGPARTNLDKLDLDFLSSDVQQLNLFFRSELTDDFTAFVNFEYLSNFSTERGWGEFSMEEAWLNYSNNNAFNIRSGLLIPKFNYLNEVKNKMPLLPYIVRPLVYEASLTTVIDVSNYLPERAFFQVYGNIASGDVNFEYAAYMGSAETKYLVVDSTASGSQRAGSDPTNIDFKLFGARIGAKYGDLRVGVSATSDKDNQQETLGEDVSRFRIGADFGFTFSNLFLDAEFISVNLSPESTSRDINKLFYYGTLGYNFSDEIFAYGTYSYLQDKQTQFLESGLNGLLFGVGYKPSYNVVIKGQYSSYTVTNGHASIPIIPGAPPLIADVELDAKTYAVAVSVLF